MSEPTGQQPPIAITLFSFGFKHGYPEADMVWDARVLPNPYWVPELKAHTGLEAQVAQYVLDSEDGREYLRLLEPFVDFLLTKFAQSDRSEIRLAVGCTGGRHRSVAVVQHLAAFIAERGFTDLHVYHRDIDKE